MADYGRACIGSYKKLHDFSGAPPSYDDVITNPVGTPQPSAPPLDDLPPPSSTSYQRGSSPAVYHEPASTNNQTCGLRMKKVVASYVGYSMAHHLRKYITPKSEQLDPELDVEAHFSSRAVRDARSKIVRKERLRCITGWLWGFGVIQVLIYLLLPLAMLITGGIGFSDCPYQSNAIILYLLLGGSMVAIFSCMRSIPSLMTCFRNRDYLSTLDSGNFTACICLFELIFYVVTAGNLAVLILGTIWIFNKDTPFCSLTITTDCCHRYVYVASAFFNVFQYVMYTITFLYSCLVLGCIRNMDKPRSKQGSNE